VKKDYQRKAASAATTSEVVLPDEVSVAMAELAGAMKEGLLAMAVGAGFQVMAVMMEDNVTTLAGPRGRHDLERSAVRHGSEAGSVTLGGRRVPVRRPRVRTADRSAEVAVPAYELFSSTDLLGPLVLEKMMAKLSTRRYGAGLEPVGTQIEASARSTSRSAVSRRFVAATEAALAELMAEELSGLDLVAIMIDGVHFADHLCVVALGIGIDGTKHPLGLVEGDTENATVVKDLLAGLRDRGMDTTRPILAVLDGAKALTTAVNAVFDHPVIQRCQLHKIRNVRRYLPDSLAATVESKMRAAYHDPNALQAEATLHALAKDLEKKHPGAAGSLREGIAETLTVIRLGVPPTLARTLRSTNPIESMIEIARDHSTNVKRWRDGDMALRWCAAGMLEARKQFRRVNGHLHLRALRAALYAHTDQIDYNTKKEDAA
jgi:transposase-like protein